MKLATWVPKEVDHQGLDKEGRYHDGDGDGKGLDDGDVNPIYICREVVLEAKGVQGVAVDLGDSLEEGSAPLIISNYTFVVNNRYKYNKS